jgi:hypothetical protein
MKKFGFLMHVPQEALLPRPETDTPGLSANKQRDLRVFRDQVAGYRRDIEDYRMAADPPTNIFSVTMNYDDIVA